MKPGPVDAEPVEPRERRRAGRRERVVDFARASRQMRLDRQVELARVHHDLLERRVAHRVRRVRREREREPRRVLERIARGEARAAGTVGVGRVRRRESRGPAVPSIARMPAAS